MTLGHLAAQRRWQEGGGLMRSIPISLSGRGGRSSLMSESMLHRIYSQEIDSFWNSGLPGSPKESVVDAYRVETPVDGDVAKNGDRCALPVSHPASAADWIAELQALKGSTRERFYQLGEWIIGVIPSNQYAYPWARLSLDHEVKSFRAHNVDYRTLAGNCRMGSDNLNRAAAGLLRGRAHFAPFVDSFGATLMVATFVSETFRRRETWGINMMLLDLVNMDEVDGRKLEWKTVFEEGMHPMCRGNTGDGTNVDTPRLENGILIRWLQQRVKVGGQSVGVPELSSNRARFYAFQGLTVAEEQVWQNSRSGENSETALRATFQRRLRNVESEFLWE